MSELGSMLGRWHQWRRQYSHERGFVRSALPLEDVDCTSEEQLEDLTMRAIERTIEQLPRPLQLALQHVARAECMGVEMLSHPDLFDDSHREAVCALALRELRARLEILGVL